MGAVAANSSEDVLRIVDQLLVEGQSAQHFARQMVRFLRNALVAKVAGSDSQVLQISTDERERVARVAEAFSEEDLTRFLQIMLRTHNDLGYKQEQRFHLELGLLKLVHAQRLLPLEELLSGEAGQAHSEARRLAEVSLPCRHPELRRQQRNRRALIRRKLQVASRARFAFTKPSPFESDRSRKAELKSEPKSEASQSATRAQYRQPPPQSPSPNQNRRLLDRLPSRK